MNLNAKVSFINGGARIGATVIRELARKGCHVAVSYRSSRSQAETAAREAGKYGVKTCVCKGDMTKVVDVRRVLSQIKKAMGRLDIVVNMASIYGKTPFASLSSQIWEKEISSNLKSAFLTVKYSASLLRQHGGRVINFADWSAASGRPRYKSFLPYYAAKMGVIGLTQAQALELAPRILVNAIAPGPILPPANLTNEETMNVKQVTPLGKWGGALEIAKAVIFLCETDFITGECVRVDGGRHLY